ncbi:UNVERIFIED_CONTAM: hypothetical protein PYX00_008815 [Menopon gallinae]|uniref:non-specific serine/threonine protein kinase n=1 Tax=Menopon gallinae TaxID=328185 RepID=A0AAW2HPE2_9NEOP
MEECHPLTSRSWSTLSTVRSIDVGPGFSNNIVPRAGEICQMNAKSLFIESLIDQLCKLFEKDPHERRKTYNAICSKLFDLKLIGNTYQLEELSSLRGYYQHAMMNLLGSPDSSLYKMSLQNLEWSRYYSEYEETSFIAAGGFGKVYKAKHRLDQVFYAVKKISVKLQNISLLIMGSNEVKTLAKLNHTNIVQYKAAWLEPVFYSSPALPNTNISHSSDSDEIVFQESNSSLHIEGNSSSSAGNENDKKLMLCKYKNDFGENEFNTSRQISATLYVSMQLCDETLREWLNKRNAENDSIDLPLCLEIMIQATKGVEYIHSCNIVHHDIKPSNIFLSNNLRTIQVGDFGLACCLQGHNHSGCPLEGGRFGTRLYAAPEQHRGQCNPKSDMYSLGLVFIELVSIFATEMERIDILSKCRSGDVPDSVPEQLVPIIKKLISTNAEERPTSSDLLKEINKLLSKPSEIKASLSVTKTQLISINENTQVDSMCQTKDCKAIPICDVHEMLKVKEKEISELKLKLAKQETEIAQLKKKQVIKEYS